MTARLHPARKMIEGAPVPDMHPFVAACVVVALGRGGLVDSDADVQQLGKQPEIVVGFPDELHDVACAAGGVLAASRLQDEDAFARTRFRLRCALCAYLRGEITT